MGRPRQYASDAERQAAYRARQREQANGHDQGEEIAQLRAQIEAARQVAEQLAQELGAMKIRRAFKEQARQVVALLT